MTGYVEEVLKKADETLCVARVKLKEEGIDCTLNISSQEDIRVIGEYIDIDLCLYSEEYEILSDSSSLQRFERVESDNQSNTYCRVVGEVEEAHPFKEELHVLVKCLGNELEIICYNFEDNPVKAGDIISAICWVEMIENNPIIITA